MNIISVKKSNLPVPLVIEDDEGRIEVRELVPAGKGKLGACVQRPSPLTEKLVRESIERT